MADIYPNISPDGGARASNLAYFPLFPWLVRRIGDTGLLSLSQALVVASWLGGLLAVWAIFAVGNALYGRWAGIALSALWGMAPASLALTMGYPEGMFTAAAAAALLCLIPAAPGLGGRLRGRRRPAAPFRRGGDRDGCGVFPGGVRTLDRLASVTPRRIGSATPPRRAACRAGGR